MTSLKKIDQEPLRIWYDFSWLIFAALWYLTFFLHGDFEPLNIANESFVPCVSAIQDFTSCFLFSVETQHTIGYGGRYVVSDGSALCIKGTIIRAEESGMHPIP